MTTQASKRKIMEAHQDADDARNESHDSDELAGPSLGDLLGWDKVEIIQVDLGLNDDKKEDT